MTRPVIRPLAARSKDTLVGRISDALTAAAQERIGVNEIAALFALS